MLLVAALAVPAAAQASGEYEPNDTAATAFGPITDGTFSGTIETSNDQDWFRVDTTNRDVQLSVDLTNDGGADCGSYCPVFLAIGNLQESEFDGAGTQADRPGETGHIAYTLHDPGTYTIHLWPYIDSYGQSYHFTISRTAGAPVSSVPSTGGRTGDTGSVDFCAGDMAALRQARKARNRAASKFRHHRTKHNRRKLSKAKRRLRHAQAVIRNDGC